jgi:hypothetical protein
MKIRKKLLGYPNTAGAVNNSEEGTAPTKYGIGHDEHHGPDEARPTVP